MTRTPDVDPPELPFPEHEPPSGWQTAVWAREREDIRRRWLRNTLAVLGCAVVGGVLGVALLAAIIALGGWP